MQFNIPKELNSEFKFNKEFGLVDLVTVVVGFLIAYMLSGLVYQPLIIFWYIFFEISVLFLFRKSKDNPGLRNYKSILLLYKRDKNIYRRI